MPCRGVGVLKIMHVTKKYPNALGGDAVVVAHLERMQKESSHEVVILTTNCREIIDGSNVYKFGLATTPSSLDRITLRRLVSLIALVLRSFRIIGYEQPDIIHTHSPDMLCAVSFAARHYGVPIVHTCHVVTFNDLHHDIVRRKSELRLLRWAKPRTVTAPNSFSVEDLKRAGIASASILPNGIDVDSWECTRAVHATDDFTFVAVGRLEKQKGFDYLLKATALLKHETARFRVLVIGEGAEGDALATLARRLEITDVVAFLGRQDQAQVRQIYASCGAMVISSLWETTPITLLEAWACRLPVIATNTGLLQESIGQEAGAYVVPAEDEVALAKAMYRVMTDSDLGARIAEIGYDEVVAKYAWAKVYQLAESVYQKTLL